ncbi:MAG: tetratricopeptide repeat protein [Nitrososphaeraceae archaeon]
MTFPCRRALQPNKQQNGTAKELSLANVGRLSDAIACYDRAIELNPNLTATWNNKGYALSRLGNKEAIIILSYV